MCANLIMLVPCGATVSSEDDQQITLIKKKMKKRVQHRVRSSEALRLMVTNSWARPRTKGDWMWFALGQKAAKGTTNHVVSSDWFVSGTCKNHQLCHIQTWFGTRSESNRVTVLTSMIIFWKYICLAGQGKLGWNWCHGKNPQMFSLQPELTKTESWSVERVPPSQRNYIKQIHATRLKFEVPRCLHSAGRITKRRLR